MADWDSILDNGERILWQGRPDGRFSVPVQNWFMVVFGLFFTGFALFWMILASGAGGTFWMFGLLHFSVGFGIIFFSVTWPTFVRRRTWYTLSDRRAFLATDLPLSGKRLKSYPISSDTALELGGDTPGSVYFAHRTKRTKNGTRSVPVGFERIPDAADVMRLMRDVQRGAA
ncbi:aspartate carbamoyltransferase catalytic subunit [Pseudaestuariivita sp.]|uniref:aspartate carbamoyltransferase catalytic subunit n=1 Tax=Pseudaestuariivita sp. TaxID=2211669 RepID=UPI004058EC17